MKGSELFKEQIKAYIELWAMESEANLEAHCNKDKNIDDCVTYILNQVKKSGLNGFGDQEVFDMAVEYYTTKKVDIGGKLSGQVVINRTVELTEAEKKEAKEKAIREIISEEKAKARKKPTTKKQPHKIDPKGPLTSVEKAALKAPKAKEPKKEEPKQPTQPTLF